MNNLTTGSRPIDTLTGLSEPVTVLTLFLGENTMNARL